MENKSDVLLYGYDEEENIVAVETDGKNAIIYKRDENGISHYKDSFSPFMWLKQKLKFPLSLQQKIEITDLDGTGVYNRIAHFKHSAELFRFKKNYVSPMKSAMPDKFEEDYTDYSLIPDQTQQYLTQSGKTLFKGMAYDDLKICAFDLETNGIQKDENGKYTCNIEMIGFADNNGYEDVFVGTEAEMILQLINVITKKDYDVILSYNGFEFDWKIVCDKANDLGIKLKLGRDGSTLTNFMSTIRFGDNKSLQITRYSIRGRHNIDLYYGVKKYDSVSRSFASGLGLKNVIRELSMERENRTHIPGDEIHNFLESDFELVKEYCLDDVRDTLILGKFLLLQDFYGTQMMPMSFEKFNLAGNSGKIASLFFRAYYLHDRAIPEPMEKEPFEGAGVRCDKHGFDRNIFHLDVTSLYPSIMLRYKIKPQSDDLNIFLGMLEVLKERRMDGKTREANAKKNKNAVEENKWYGYQNALKTLINSFYGSLGSKFFPWNDMSCAERVTSEGRKILGIMIDKTTEAGMILKNADTDGIYVTLIDFVKWNNFIGKKYGELVPTFKKKISEVQ